eukprot:comp22746_c3_seq1/m.35478 comp22746_c3_seq1/g.35478  ORF comp22746_c3_seq1/g.35478 comp22746_c3_seq1/m.35478 type:complete len:397 (-) comp22746_c3_seq1:93-1283(-)
MRLYIGDDNGFVKGVFVEGKKVVSRWGTQDRSREINRMCWGPTGAEPGKEQVVVGMKNSVVQVYGGETGLVSAELKGTKGTFAGLEVAGGFIVSSNDQGHVLYRDWEDHETKHELDLKLATSRLRLHPSEPQKFAVGGKENDLKIYDVNGNQPIFKAKNVSNDEVDLRVPVFVTDLHFIPGTDGSQIAVTTGHYHIRLYDTRAQKKPVFSTTFGEHPIMCLAVTQDAKTAIFGNSIGEMRSLDLRTRRLHLGYKGSSGSVRAVAVHPHLPYVASVGLDRYARVHRIDTGKLYAAVYLKQRLTSVLFAAEGLVKVEEKKSVEDVKEEKKKETEEGDADDIWNSMVEVKETKPKAEKAKKRIKAAPVKVSSEEEEEIDDSSEEEPQEKPAKKKSKAKK